jgi:hypothetical protein
MNEKWWGEEKQHLPMILYQQTAQNHNVYHHHHHRQTCWGLHITREIRHFRLHPWPPAHNLRPHKPQRLLPTTTTIATYTRHHTHTHPTSTIPYPMLHNCPKDFPPKFTERAKPKIYCGCANQLSWGKRTPKKGVDPPPCPDGDIAKCGNMEPKPKGTVPMSEDILK